jgi:phenylacetate-CoA ligase
MSHDLAAPIDEPCGCGIGLPRMSSVAGRIQDLIQTLNGDHIDAYLFSYLIMRFPEIEWFQVVQREFDRLLLRIVSYSGVTVRASGRDRRPGPTPHRFRFPGRVRAGM